MRARDLHKSWTKPSSIYASKKAFPDVDYRYLFMEENTVEICLDFRNETTWPLQEQGRALAQQILTATPQGFASFDTVDDWETNEKEYRQIFRNFADYYKQTLDAFKEFF